MKKTMFFAILLLALGASKCEKKSMFTPGTPFALKFGEVASATGKSVSVALAAIKEDSRCPKEVNCIQAGRAIVELSVMEGKETAVLQLVLEGSGAASPGKSAGSYTYSLQKLDPWPVAGKTTAPADYVATLLIEKTATE
ncbi:MAG: hypothetical protein SH848_00320 [Saprospiraceae bacterium]|nr:hypothetical protein [Saprospiraceae bacterium]MDZ4702340.1 hypothetical protein [Saprospiraceae bacterium]